MSSALAVWSLIQKSLEEQTPVVLLFVLESLGSSPGRQGFCMAVNSLGKMAGSVGGGIMEHKFVETAKAYLYEQQRDASVHRQIHSKSAATNQSGMICSGEQTILLYAVRQSDGRAVSELVHCLTEGKTGWLQLSKQGIRFGFTPVCPETGFTGPENTDWMYHNPIGHKPLIHIIGGGHCSLALTRLMDALGFQVWVYDDRPKLNTMDDNDRATRKILLSSYQELSEILPSNPTEYVVVMTFGYRTDDVVIRTLKDRQFAFLGLLGSRKKIEKMMGDYLCEGFDSGWLSRLSAPVGLPIKSQTPEEIAVSIAAQIIAVKNKDVK